MNSQLSIRGLTKKFEAGTPNEKIALDKVDLEVQKGEFITLLGSNGAGKSTLFNAILGKFLPEYYKPSYYAAASASCHTMNGLFPHVDPAELFVFLGVANGISALGLPTVDLALRYFLIGIVINFLRGWITDFMTAYVQKQQGVKLSKELAPTKS